MAYLSIKTFLRNKTLRKLGVLIEIVIFAEIAAISLGAKNGARLLTVRHFAFE